MQPDLNPKTELPAILKRHRAAILESWLRYQFSDRSAWSGKLTDAEIREQSRALLDLIVESSQSARPDDLGAEAWNAPRSLLNEISKARTAAGFTASETARFVFSLKEALFALFQRELANNPKGMAELTWASSQLLDNLGLITVEAALRAREEMIGRQQQEMLELSTPVVKLWRGIVAVPLIGTLDSERTQIVMENLLQQVVETEAAIAIIDITGVPTVDTLVAQHLLKTIAAARLMGADCIISGIRPQIAATIVHLGVDLGNVITKSNLADAFQLALRRQGLTVQTRPGRPKEDHGTNSDS